MVCITHKSGGCPLMLLSFSRHHLLLPSLTLSFFSTLMFSVLPALTSSLWSTTAASTATISTLTTTQSMPHTTIPPVTLTYSPTVLPSPLSPQSSTRAPVVSVSTMSPTSSLETSVTAPYLTPTSRSTSKTLLLLFPGTGKPAKRVGKFFNMLPSTSRSDLTSLPPSRSPLPKSSQTPHTKLVSKSLLSPSSAPSTPPPSLATSRLPFSTSSTPETALPLSSRPAQTPRGLPTSISTTSTPVSPVSSPSSSLPTQTSSSPPRPPPPKRLPPPRRARPPPPPPRLPHTTRPLFDRQPFIVTWNIPDLVCNRYNVSLDTSTFRGVATPAKVPGQFLSLFYTDRLGLYPHVDRTGTRRLNGGIPQQGNLKASMSKARTDITHYIPSRNSRGLAVVDWEEWRPLWDRNWGSKRMYQSLSVGLVLQRFPFLSGRQAAALAKHDFQKAARSFMSDTLSLGRAMRPNYLWGFYLFPNCYNYGWLEPGYNGRCSQEVRLQNDKLLWLWESSTALFPSIYLQASLRNSHKAALMVRNRVKEALRVSSLPRRNGTAAAPVFVYARPVFIDQNRHFLSQGDLVRTIGESAAVGASGAVLWGASADYDDKPSCEALSSYLSSTLNPYVVNVTAAAQLCSDLLCQGNGRCVRKNYNSDHHLHLSPGRFRIARVHGRLLVLGRPGLADLKLFTRRFTCQCYEGLGCAPRRHRELVKALAFRVKLGLYSKAQTLNKASLNAIMEQSSFAKENVKRTFKV